MIRIVSLYPELMNLYGDRGNVMVLVRRCGWRELPVALDEIGLGQVTDLADADVVLLGGCSDREQSILEPELPRLSDALAAAVDRGVVVLAVCGGYQLLGRYYTDAGGAMIAGLGLLDLHTDTGQGRLRGNAAVAVDLGGAPEIITGFENHGGRTHLGSTPPLGRVLAGSGNNGIDGQEGARLHNVFGTYLHGPLLARNPWLADHLLELARRRQGIDAPLSPLDDSLERAARGRLLARLGVTTPTR